MSVVIHALNATAKDSRLLTADNLEKAFGLYLGPTGFIQTAERGRQFVNAEQAQINPFIQLKLAQLLSPQNGLDPFPTFLQKINQRLVGLGRREFLLLVHNSCYTVRAETTLTRPHAHAQITAVSNSSSQRQYIEAEAVKRGLGNLRVITCDMNRFDIDQRFDRIVSVEMFEHMMNWRDLAHPGPGSQGFAAPGTFALAMVFLVAFVLYYFVNWKYLSTVWGLS